MKVWLLGLGLAFLCAVHAEEEEANSIDYGKAQGLWHILGAATDCKKFLKHKDDMKVVRATLMKLEDGSLKTSSAINLPDGGCKKIEMIFQKGEDGKFYHNCKLGKKIIDSAITDYDSYAIISMTMQKEGKEPGKFVTLFGRERNITPEILEKFMETVREAGLTEEQTKIFPAEEVACTEVSIE